MEKTSKIATSRFEGISKYFRLSHNEVAELIVELLIGNEKWLGNLSNDVEDLLYEHFMNQCFETDYCYEIEHFQNIDGYSKNSIFGDVYNYAEDSNISLTDEETMKDLLAEMLERTVIDSFGKVEFQMAYIFKHLQDKEFRDKLEAFLNTDFPAFYIEFSTLNEYQKYLMNVKTLNDLQYKPPRHLNEIFDCIQAVRDDDVYIKNYTTIQIKLSEFISNDFTVLHENRVLAKVPLKDTSSPLFLQQMEVIQTISIYDDLVTKQIFVVPNYIEAYKKPYNFEHMHFAIYNNRAYTGLFLNDETMNIEGKFIAITDLDFVVPLFCTIH